MAENPQSLEGLSLSPEQRRALELRGSEGVRVLAATSRTILLGKTGTHAASLPIPVDRALVLSADVRAFPLADVLHLIHSAGKSGVLYFQWEEVEKSVYLHGGEVVFAASNQEFDRLGRCLVRQGAISRDQHREADARFRASQSAGPFGRVLVELGFLSPQELWEGVRSQIEEMVRSLFSYGGGTVLLFEGEVRPDNLLRLALPTQRLIAEGLEHRDELLRFIAQVEAPQVRIEVREDAPDSLDESERALCDAFRTEHAFPQACRRARLDPLTGARTLMLLRERNAVRVQRDDESAAPAVESRHADEVAVRARVVAHLALLTELAAPIVAVEGVEGLGSRLQDVVEQAAIRHPEMLAALQIGNGGALDPEELVRRALRFPGSREREVSAALGELVSYLEFELLNHPKIENPEHFLEGLDKLREAL